MSNDTHFLEALLELQQHRAFTVLMDELKRRRDATTEAMRKGIDMLQIGRAQGGFGALDNLINDAENARETLLKRRR